jgi:predicted transcriptional regulator
MGAYLNDKKAVIERFFRLRDVLGDLSKKLNVFGISERDLGVFHAVFELTKDTDVQIRATAQMVSKHPSCSHLSPATLYRSLIHLCENGAIECSGDHPKLYWIEY